MMSSRGKNVMSWRKRAVTLAGVKENIADVRLPFPISTKESKYFTHWVFFFFCQFHLIKEDKDDAEKWESLYQVRSGARENLPSDHDTAQAKGEVSKAPIKGDFHIHEHRRMCVLLRESSVRWRQRLTTEKWMVGCRLQRSRAMGWGCVPSTGRCRSCLPISFGCI